MTRGLMSYVLRMMLWSASTRPLSLMELEDADDA